jgi:aspartate/methionine/tyrosine aminotransferase
MDSDARSWPGRTRAIVRPPIAQVNALARELAAQGRELVDLGQAVMGLPPPAAALRRAAAWLEGNAAHSYSPDPGMPELREAVARFARRHKGIEGAAASGVMITCGANQAFVNALLTVTDPGDEVILFGPGYFDHEFAVKLAACTPVELGLVVYEGRWEIDMEALRAALTDRTRVVVIVSPGNPTGAVLPPEQVEAVRALCSEHGLWLVSDETYDLLTFPPAVHTSPASLPGHERVVVLGSFSKVFALASWRVGWLMGPREMVEECVKVQDALVVCASVPGQHAALGALDSVDEFVPAALRELTERRDALMQALGCVDDLEPVAPQGATFVLARLRGETDDVAWCRRLLTERGVITVPGSAFGRHGAGHVRISFGNQPPDVIAEAFSSC